VQSVKSWQAIHPQFNFSTSAAICCNRDSDSNRRSSSLAAKSQPFNLQDVRMNRSLLKAVAPLAVSALLVLLTTSVQAQTEPARKSKPVKTTQQKKSEAAGLAVASTAVGAITANQLDIAARVLTGKAECDSGEHVNVDAIAANPGHFKVSFRKASYTMTPEETSTGAVRLQDKKSGVVWLQIPTKSMLMNQKAGQRMVDGCTQSEQRVAMEAAKAAAKNTPAQ
jgi:hypothetical protein